MKTIKKIIAILLITATTTGIQSCQKDKESEPTPTVDTESAAQSQQSSDEAIQTNESELTMNDVNTAIENSSYGKTSLIVGASIDSVIAEKKLLITYNGKNAEGNRSRAGLIIVQLTSGSNWKDKNAVITITFIGYKVTKVSTGKIITFNGTYLITNVDGGLVRNLKANTYVTHKINGTMNISFDDGTQRSWTITRQRIIGLTITGGAYIMVSGYGVNDSFNNISVTGKNRAGVSFYTLINTPIIFSSGCSWVPVSGEITHKGTFREITLTYGVDASGNAVILPACPYGYKINWSTLLGINKQAVISY